MVIAGFRQDLVDALETSFPDGDLSGASGSSERGPFDTDAADPDALILAVGDGRLESIDLRELIRVAEAGDTRIDVPVRPGDFLTRYSATAGIHEPSGRSTARGRRTVRKAFRPAKRRSPRQDGEPMIFERVEIADCGLSPGVNDPFTAVRYIDNLNAALQRYVWCPTPGDVLRSDDGCPRVRARRRDPAELLNTATRQIHHYGRDDPTGPPRIRRLFDDVAGAATDAPTWATIRQAADEVLARADGN